MVFEGLVIDALTHVGFGFSVATLDYAVYRIANPKPKRIEEKTEVLKSIDVLLGSQESSPENPHPIPQDSYQYSANIDIVKNYLIRTGVIKQDLPFAQRWKERTRKLIYDERINNMSAPQKWGAAIGIELLGDTIIGLGYYMQVIKVSPGGAFLLNLYQIPCFRLGMWKGNLAKRGFHWITTSSDEKKLDKTLQQLMKETPIVDIVLQYKPSDKVIEEYQQQGTPVYQARLTQAGKNAYRGMKRIVLDIASTTSTVAHDLMAIPEKRREIEAQRKEAAKHRFDDLTKGR